MQLFLWWNQPIAIRYVFYKLCSCESESLLLVLDILCPLLFQIFYLQVALQYINSFDERNLSLARSRKNRYFIFLKKKIIVNNFGHRRKINFKLKLAESKK